MTGPLAEHRRWNFRPRIPQPAAGADWSIVNDRQGIMRIRNLTFQLLTSAAVANRVVRIEATDGNEVYFRTVASAAQAGGLTGLYGAFPGVSGLTQVATVKLVTWPVDGVNLCAGSAVRAVTTALDVSGQFSAGWVGLAEHASRRRAARPAICTPLAAARGDGCRNGGSGLSDRWRRLAREWPPALSS